MKNEKILELDKGKELQNELLKDVDIDDIEEEDDAGEDEEDIDDKELAPIYEAFKDYVIIDGLLQYKNILDDPQLYELYQSRIDIKSLLADEDIITEYRYASAQRNSVSFIKNLLEPLLIGVEITDEEYTVLSKNISERLDDKTDEYFTTLKKQVEKIPTEEVFSFLIDNDKDYLKCMIYNGLDRTDNDLLVYTLYRYYPYYFTPLFSNHIRNKYNAYRKKLKIASRAYKSQSITKDIDTQMKKLLLNNYTDKIIEMYKSGLSFNKIQAQLTAECIGKNEIPSSIERYDRRSGVEKKPTTRPALLSMNVIKKIIKDADVQISKVGRYSKAS